jgi:cysteine-rich repeat protein
MCLAVIVRCAGTIATLCVGLAGVGCERSPQIGRSGGTTVAGAGGSGGSAVGGSTTGTGGVAVGGATTGSGGVAGTGGCGAACSGGASVIVLSDPYVNCGNGRRDLDEYCDDGNRVVGDGCNRYCQVEVHWICPTWGQPCLPLCGNGAVDPDETCDDENRVSGDGCSADCQTIERGWRCRVPGKACTPMCGDSILLATETCDDGNAQGGDGCSRACQVEAGFVCPDVGKPCRPASCSGADGAVPCDGGPPHIAICGDGMVSGDEECDDGNDPNRNPHNDDKAYGGCTTLCRLGPYCGDGLVNGSEICDEGPANLPSYGSPGCSFACTKTRYCGDGIVESFRDEMCEPFPGDRICMPTCLILIH